MHATFGLPLPLVIEGSLFFPVGKTLLYIYVCVCVCVWGLDPFEHCGTQGREVPLEVRQGRQLPFMLTAEMAMGWSWSKSAGGSKHTGDGRVSTSILCPTKIDDESIVEATYLLINRFKRQLRLQRYSLLQSKGRSHMSMRICGSKRVVELLDIITYSCWISSLAHRSLLVIMLIFMNVVNMSVEIVVPRKK